MRSRSAVLICSLLLLVGCSTTPEPTPPDTSVRDACEALHAAAPHQWSEYLIPVHAAGVAAEPHLVAAIERSPAAAGAQASVAALGRIGSHAAAALCCRLLAEHSALATEAALALGDLAPATDTRPTLYAALQNRLEDATVRTAAACSLARHGDREHAATFLAAIVRAGTPAGRQDEQDLGLPPKSRWALERYLVQRCLQQLGHDDLATELDSDAPWPTLEALAPRIGERLRQPR